MTNRHLPPGLTSISRIVLVKPFGPHHLATCFGSVQTAQTSSRGASSKRVAAVSRLALSRVSLFLAGMPLLLFFVGLLFVQVIARAIQPRIPQAAIALEPHIDLLEGVRRDPARPPLGIAAARDQ